MLLLSGLLGALLGASMTFGFNMWKFHRDERSARCDELCKAVWEAGLLASEYWSKKHSAVDQKVVEAKILASQTLVDGLYADFIESLKETDDEISEQLSELIDSLSGGLFSVEDRPADLDRMSRSPQIAGMTIVKLRRRYRESIPFHSSGKAWRQSKRTELEESRRYGV